MSRERSVTVQAREGEELCPYCRERLARGERVLVCEGCQAPYHEDCLRTELGRCATLGCSGRRALPRAFGAGAPTPPVRVELPRQAPPPDRTRCAACREALKGEEPVLVCARCGAEHHPRCAGRLTGCAHPGCDGQQALRRAHGVSGPWWHLFALGAVFFGLLSAALAVSQVVRGAWSELVAVVALALLGGALALIARLGHWADRPVAFGTPPAPVPAPRRVPAPRERCASCGQAVARGEPLLECEGCRGLHHAGCLREAGRCRVQGCTGARAIPRRAR